MRELPTERDALPDEVETEEVNCPGCGTTGYVVNEAGPHDVHPPECRECRKDHLRADLDSWDDDRTHALDRVQSEGFLPFHDYDGRLITEVDVRRGPPGAGKYVRKIVWIVERDCPECGHDRADHTRWNIWTVEGGEAVRCRACDHTIEKETSL